MISAFRTRTDKPHIYFDRSTGYWRVSKYVKPYNYVKSSVYNKVYGFIGRLNLHKHDPSELEKPFNRICNVCRAVFSGYKSDTVCGSCFNKGY